MKTNYNLSFLLKNTGCYSSGKIKDLFPKGKEEVSYLDIINSEIPLEDKFWFFYKRVFSEEQNRQISIELAECVLPLFEDQHPDNKSPREAIEAAKLYLAGDITIKELEIKREAVYASAAACADADAASAAACAAVYAAGAASRAAGYAVTSAARSAANTTYEQKLIDVLLNFIELNKN